MQCLRPENEGVTLYGQEKMVMKEQMSMMINEKNGVFYDQIFEVSGFNG